MASRKRYDLISSDKDDQLRNIINRIDPYNKINLFIETDPFERVDWTGKINAISVDYDDHGDAIVSDVMDWENFINIHQSHKKTIQEHDEILKLENVYIKSYLDENPPDIMAYSWRNIKDSVKAKRFHYIVYPFLAYDLIDQKSESIKQYTEDISERLNILSEEYDDWDDSIPVNPNEASVQNARVILGEMAEIICKDHAHIKPFISNDEDGDITVGWHADDDDRELHLTILENDVYYVKVSGENINMEQGRLDKSEYAKTWKWLVNE